MKRLSILLAIILLIGAFSIINAQNDPPPGGQTFVSEARPANLLQQLGLTRPQVQQLRRINADLQPQMREAQRNWREANLALDEAIYADESNDEIVQERIKAAQFAQTELIRNRAMLESAIRKVLTRDQLIKFRQLRQEFKQRQAKPANNRQRRMENPDKMIRNPQKQPLKRRILRPNQRPIQ